MDAQASGFVTALTHGDYKTFIMLALCFGLAHWGVFILSYAVSQIHVGITWLRGKANEFSLLAATTIDDRFFNLLDKAVSNQAHLQVALSDAVADGSIDSNELTKLLNAIWEDLISNIGMTDWTSFGLALLGNAQASVADTKNVLRRKFDANVYAALGNAITSPGLKTRRDLFRSVRALRNATGKS